MSIVGDKSSSFSPPGTVYKEPDSVGGGSKWYYILIIVIASLLLLVVFIICIALIVRWRKNKVARETIGMDGRVGRVNKGLDADGDIPIYEEITGNKSNQIVFQEVPDDYDYVVPNDCKPQTNQPCTNIKQHTPTPETLNHNIRHESEVEDDYVFPVDSQMEDEYIVPMDIQNEEEYAVPIDVQYQNIGGRTQSAEYAEIIPKHNF